MLELVVIPFMLQVLLPVALAFWIAVATHRSHLEWLLSVTLVVGYVVAVTEAGLWLIVPSVVPRVYAVLLLVALALSLRDARRRNAWPSGARGAVLAAVRGLLAVLVVALLVHVRSGRRAPADALALSFPLRHGTYAVANGGRVELLNAHLKTLTAERFEPYRGQSYGVDIVRTGALGSRARGLLPRDPGAYVIYGDTVVAPCGGVVIVAADGFPDMPPPEPDRAHMAGNHVIVVCEGAWVVLGHLQRGSVRVQPGTPVHTGDPLGLVGNSGNTFEPHLHIHAQSPGTREAPLGGVPLPIRLDGRYLVRNDRLTR